MTVRADFFLKRGDRDAIIDLSGFDKTVVSFLQSHDFLVLSLGGAPAPMDLIRKTLGFLGVPFDGGPLSLAVSESNSRKRHPAHHLRGHVSGRGRGIRYS